MLGWEADEGLFIQNGQVVFGKIDPKTKLAGENCSFLWFVLAVL